MVDSDCCRLYLPIISRAWYTWVILYRDMRNREQTERSLNPLTLTLHLHLDARLCALCTVACAFGFAPVPQSVCWVVGTVKAFCLSTALSAQQHRGPEVNTPVCRSRELICKKSIKRLKANCKFRISGKTINYESPPFKDRHKYTLVPGVNPRINTSQHHSKSEVAFTHLPKCFSHIPLNGNFEIACFALHLITVSFLKHRTAPTCAGWR